MDNERRKNARIKKELMTHYSHEANLFKWDMSTVKDLSEGGIMITTEKPFEANTVLSLRFKLPSNPYKSIEVKGRVVCCESLVNKAGTAVSGYSTRVEFIDMKDECKGMIREYIVWFTNSNKGGGIKCAIPARNAEKIPA